MSTNENIAYDDVLKKIGEFGRFQKITCCALTVCYVMSSFTTMGYMFWAARPDHWCDVERPGSLENLTEKEWKGIIIPKEGDDFSQCSYFDLNFTYHDESVNSHDSDVNFTDEATKCSKWKYDTSQYKSTVVTQMDLVCDRFWLRSVSQSAFLMGKGAGLLFLGRLADRFGRRVIILTLIPIQTASTLALCFVREIYTFIFLRFLQAATLYGIEISVYVTMMEIVGRSWRVIVSSLHMCTWAVSIMVLSGLAYLIRDGFYLQLVLFAPHLVYISYYWLVCESPRWLLYKQRHDEFTRLIKKMAKVNGKSPEEIEDLTENKLLESYPGTSGQQMAWTTLCRDPYILFISVVQAFLWFTTSSVYYGLSFNATSLAGNDYLDTFISGAVEVPAYLLVIPIYGRLGRRISAFVLFLLSSVAVGSTAFIHEGLVTVILVVTSAGKFFVTILFNMVYLYTTELYPTSVRAMGLSLSAFFARLGSMLSPFAVDLGEFYPGLPLLVFALVCFIATFSTLVLPETQGKTLPQTFDDIKQLPTLVKCSTCCTTENQHENPKDVNRDEVL